MQLQVLKITFARNEMKSADKGLLLINLDLSDLILFMFTAHTSSICFSATALTPSAESYRRILSISYLINDKTKDYHYSVQTSSYSLHTSILVPYCVTVKKKKELVLENKSGRKRKFYEYL